MIQHNNVQYLVVTSQKGRDFTFTNPWSGQNLVMYRNGHDGGALSGTKITIKTSTDETVSIATAGTTYEQIVQRMNQQVGFNSLPFTTGFESSDPQLTWTSTVDTGPKPAGGESNVVGICCDLSGPETEVRDEKAHTGTYSMLYSGLAENDGFAYMALFDFSALPQTISSSSMLTYWIYPQSKASTVWVSGSNSTCVALDMIFNDGTDLRDSGLKDQNGNGIHPMDQCNHLVLDAWNKVTVNLGSLSGKQLLRLDLGYDKPSGAGAYRGYIDDVQITK